VWLCRVSCRGGNVNDRDGLLGLTPLHYAAKSGCRNVGNDEMAAQAVEEMLNKVCV
jgi:ankyrin repeat protein